MSINPKKDHNDSSDELHRSSPLDSEIHASDLETTALKKAWAPAKRWCPDDQTWEDLSLVVNTTQLRDLAIALSTLLEFLLNSNIYQLLETWSSDEPAAEPLWRLAQAVAASPSILKEHAPLTDAKPATTQFRGIIPKNYLITVIAEKAKLEDGDSAEWLDIVKLWLLIHAVDRATRGNFQDGLLRDAADKLRLACLEEGRWRDIFLELKIPAHSYPRFTGRLRSRTDKLLARDGELALSDPVRQLVINLQKIDLRLEDRKPAKKSDRTHPFNTDDGIRSLFGSPKTVAQPVPEVDDYPDEQDETEELHRPKERFQGDEDQPGGTTATVDPKSSYTHQVLQGNAVMLLSIEETQYLPFSWNRPNPHEDARLEEWIRKGWRSRRPEIRFLTFTVWCARRLGRTFRRTLDIRLASDVLPEWGLDCVNFRFVRTPPRRVPGWQPKSDDQSHWVTPLASIQHIALPAEAERYLGEALSNSQSIPLHIGKLWNSDWSGTPDQLFREEFRSVLPRLTGGMLDQILPLLAYQETGDPTFSRLISSHPRSSLPGPCAYASWTGHEVDNFFGTDGKASASDNAMGSALDPIEALIVESIDRARQKILNLRLGDDYVSYHNSVVAYIGCAILAALGSRPVNDPFESPLHFDFLENFVYVNDKNSGAVRQGRPIPISHLLCTMMQEDYLVHLRITGSRFPHLAEDIAKLLGGDRRTRLPYLFMLGPSGKTWISFSEKEIANLDLFDWPLPLNHFRHRLATRLRKHGVDPEVIDAILGHAEAGSSTHGDYSLRIWKKDMDAARPALESAFESLGFERIPNMQSAPNTPTLGNFSRPARREFGIARRQQERNETLRGAIFSAKSHISNFLRERTLSDLSENEMDTLSRQLLFKHDNLPHPHGYIKYRVLLRLVDREWNKNGRRTRISKRYQVYAEERSPFNHYAPGAKDIHGKLLEHLDTIDSSELNRISLTDATIIGVLRLCIVCRISNLELLHDILNRQHYRIVIVVGAS